MLRYNVYRRFGHGHDIWIGSVKSNTGKDAFILAVKKYFKKEHYLKYTAFYVECEEDATYSLDKAYGYCLTGQRGEVGFKSNRKCMIDDAFDC